MLNWTGFNEVQAKLNSFSKQAEAQIKQLYEEAQQGTYDDSQTAVPVSTGDLKASGKTDTQDNGSEFIYTVSYGDGTPTPKPYDYPESAATTAYPDGDIEAQGYSVFVELGHLDRAGNVVAPQPYLGPAFDAHVQELLDSLEGMLS